MNYSERPAGEISSAAVRGQGWVFGCWRGCWGGAAWTQSFPGRQRSKFFISKVENSILGLSCCLYCCSVFCLYTGEVSRRCSRCVAEQWGCSSSCKAENSIRLLVCSSATFLGWRMENATGSKAVPRGRAESCRCSFRVYQTGMEKAEAAEQGQYMRGRERNDRQRTGRVRSGSGGSISMELPGLSSQEVRGPIKNHLWLFTKLERAASMCELALVEFID